MFIIFLAHKYHSRHEFLVDIEQILENCVLYNGKESPFTEKAETLVKACKATLDEVSELIIPFYYFSIITILTWNGWLIQIKY